MSLFEVRLTGGNSSNHSGSASRGSTGAVESGGPSLMGPSLSAATAARFALPLRRGPGVGAFVLAVITAGALAHVGVRLKGLEVAYDLGRERRIATEMEEQRRRLQIEIGMLKDPRRVIAIARENLKMAPPAPEAIWRLGSGRLVSEAIKGATTSAIAAAPNAAKMSPAKATTKVTPPAKKLPTGAGAGAARHSATRKTSEP